MFTIVTCLSLLLDGTHDSFSEHALDSGAASDMHIHTSNLLLLIHLVEEAFRRYTETKTQGLINFADKVQNKELKVSQKNQ